MVAQGWAGTVPARYLCAMAFWILFAFLLGLGVGAVATWWVLGAPSVPAPPAAPARPEPETVDEAPDSMSLTAQRLLTDLEKKYEGAVAVGDEEAPTPKRARAKRAPRSRPAAGEPGKPG